MTCAKRRSISFSSLLTVMLSHVYSLTVITIRNKIIDQQQRMSDTVSAYAADCMKAYCVLNRFNSRAGCQYFRKKLQQLKLSDYKQPKIPTFILSLSLTSVWLSSNIFMTGIWPSAAANIRPVLCSSSLHTIQHLSVRITHLGACFGLHYYCTYQICKQAAQLLPQKHYISYDNCSSYLHLFQDISNYTLCFHTLVISV